MRITGRREEKTEREPPRLRKRGGRRKAAGAHRRSRVAATYEGGGPARLGSAWHPPPRIGRPHHLSGLHGRVAARTPRPLGRTVTPPPFQAARPLGSFISRTVVSANDLTDDPDKAPSAAAPPMPPVAEPAPGAEARSPKRGALAVDRPRVGPEPSAEPTVA